MFLPACSVLSFILAVSNEWSLVALISPEEISKGLSRSQHQGRLEIVTHKHNLSK